MKGGLVAAFAVAVALKTAGTRNVALQDAANGLTTTANILVTAAAASRFVLAGVPSTTTAGVVLGLSVTASDAYGNVATGYTGAVHFSSSDLQAALPAYADPRLSLRSGCWVHCTIANTKTPRIRNMKSKRLWPINIWLLASAIQT